MPRTAKAGPRAHGIGGRTLYSYLSARLGIWSGLIRGIRIWGLQWTTWGAEIRVRKRAFRHTPKMSKKRKYPQRYSSMMAWRRDSTFGVGPDGSIMWAHMYLGPNNLHGPWHGDRQNDNYKCQIGKIVHTPLGIAPHECALLFAHVVCESWGPMCISYKPYVVHWSRRLACTGGADYSARRAENIGNGRKWPQMRTLMVRMEHMSHLNQGVLQNLYQSQCVQHTFWVSPRPPWIGEWQGRQVSP